MGEYDEGWDELDLEESGDLSPEECDRLDAELERHLAALDDLA